MRINYSKNKKLKEFNTPLLKEIKIEGKIFFIWINPDNGLHDKSLFLDIPHEKQVVNTIIKNIKKEDTFLDIGANIGYYTNLLPMFCKNVIGFEPIKRIYKQNLKSIQKNRYQNVKLYNLALGEKSGTSKIYENRKNIGGSSLIKNKLATEEQDNEFEEEVKIVDGDSFLKDTKIDFIKMDVEGYELYVLKGINKIIKKYKPKIIMEFSPKIYEAVKEGSSKELMEFLKENNYSIFDVETKKRFIFYEKDKIKRIRNLFCIPK